MMRRDLGKTLKRGLRFQPRSNRRVSCRNFGKFHVSGSLLRHSETVERLDLWRHHAHR